MRIVVAAAAVAALALSACEAPVPATEAQVQAQGQQTTAAPTTTPTPSTTAAPTTTAAPAGTAIAVGAAAVTNYPIPAGALFVAPTGNDANPGTPAAPLRTVNAAVSRATAGQTIVVRAGTYHEAVSAGAKSLTIQAYPRERPVFDGARAITGFNVEGGKWAATYGISLSAPTPNGPLVSNNGGYYDQVWLDGVELTQVLDVASVDAGSFAVVNGKLYLGVNPNGRKVEASAFKMGFQSYSAPGGVALKGLTFRRYAPDRYQGAVVLFSSSSLAEHLIVEDSSYAGLKFGSLTTGTTIRNSTFRRNGGLGMSAYKADDVLVERNLFEWNNVDSWNTGQEAGGVKITQSRGGLYQDNIARYNVGKGFWFDQSVINVTMARNHFSDNTVDGVMVEISAHVKVYGNTFTRNGRQGLRIVDSNDVAVWNNIAVDNLQDVGILDDPTRDLRHTANNCAGLAYPGDCDIRSGESWPRAGILFELRDVVIFNNVIGDRAASEPWSSKALIGFENSPNHYQSVGLRIDHNAYWRRSASSTQWFSFWDTGASMMTTPTFGGHRTSAGFDANGQGIDGGANPYLVGTDLTLRSATTGFATTGGTAIPADVAAALGVSTGTKVVGVPGSVPTLRVG